MQPFVVIEVERLGDDSFLVSRPGFTDRVVVKADSGVVDGIEIYRVFDMLGLEYSNHTGLYAVDIDYMKTAPVGRPITFTLHRVEGPKGDILHQKPVFINRNNPVPSPWSDIKNSLRSILRSLGSIIKNLLGK